MPMTIAMMVSGMLATEVTRCSQKSSVPDLAAPRPRTRASGVRKCLGAIPLIASLPWRDN